MTQKYSDATTPLVTSIAEIQVSFVANYCRPLFANQKQPLPLEDERILNGHEKVQVLIVQKKVSAHPATFENGTL